MGEGTPGTGSGAGQGGLGAAVQEAGAQQGQQDPTVGPDPISPHVGRAGAVGGGWWSPTPPNHPHVPAASTQLDAFAAIDHSLVGQPAITAEHGDIALKVMSSPTSLGRVQEWGAGEPG